MPTCRWGPARRIKGSEEMQRACCKMRDEGCLDQGRSSEDGEKGVDSRVSREQ